MHISVINNIRKDKYLDKKKITNTCIECIAIRTRSRVSLIKTLHARFQNVRRILIFPNLHAEQYISKFLY